jgi:hypothetical protein
MNHPYELLADLVDGTLDEGTLAGVQAHLDSCPSCREDVAHASAGREAARSLPQAPAPAELHHRVVTAAGGRGQGTPGQGTPGQGTPGWYRWAGVAAAAAVVVAIAIALPNVGDGGSELGAGAETEAPMTAAGDAEGVVSERRVEIQDRNYDAKGLEQLASAAGTDSAELVEANQSQVTLSDAAARCVSRAFDEQPVGRLARLIQARFEGREAYIAVYLEGPGANEPPDTAAVWVAAKDDCSILSFASARI